MSRPRFIALLLGLTTLLVFLPVGRFNFVNFDDTDYVTENPAVKQGLSLPGVKWAFTCFYASNWHPVTWLSHMTDCSLFGLNPGAHHFVNVLLHAANVALLFLLLWRLTQNLWPSALVAALFAWHPLHVESVAWISERKDLLSTFFALLTLLCYVHYARNKDRANWWLALVFFALGLMSKPMLVTLPFVMLLLDYWPLGRVPTFTLQRPLLIEKIPFFALTAVSCVITYLAQQQGKAVVSLAKVSLLYRLENAPVAVAGYILKLFWPSGLCVLYPMPETIPPWQVLSSVVLLLLISTAAWRWRRERPYFIVGWLWFLGMLVPVIGLVQVGAQAMADRYVYLPSIGFFIAAVFLANEATARLQTPPVIRFGLAGIASCACILATEHQLPFWRNSETLFRRAIAVTENNQVAFFNLGVALDAQGRFKEALQIYRQAEASGYIRYQLYNNIGNILSLTGQHEESLAAYQRAIELWPDFSRFHDAAGNELVALNRYDEALKEFARAQSLNPNDAAAYLDAGKTLFKMGRDAEGLDEFRAAVRLDPSNYQTLATVAHYLAANDNAAYRDGKNALSMALQADVLSSHVQPVVLDYLGMAYAATGDFSNAVICVQNALGIAAQAGMQNTGAMQMRLSLYQKHLPWRESFQTTNSVPAN